MPASPAKVNILLSTYNGEKYLPAQLESLLVGGKLILPLHGKEFFHSGVSTFFTAR